MKRAHRRTVIGVVGSALAAIAIALGMLGVGNVPSYSAPPGCGPGQPCTPASVNSATGTFGTVDAGVVLAGSIRAGSIDAGWVYASNYCMNPPTCTDTMMDVSGDQVFDSASGVTRIVDSLNLGGTFRLGTGGAGQDALWCAPGVEGAGVICTMMSNGSNSSEVHAPKGAGTFDVQGTFTTTSAKVNGLKPIVYHGSGSDERAIEAGSTATDGAGQAAVTFGTAFSAAPSCTCSTADGSGESCGHDGTTTTAVGLRLLIPAVKNVDYICVGTR